MKREFVIAVLLTSILAMLPMFSFAQNNKLYGSGDKSELSSLPMGYTTNEKKFPDNLLTDKNWKTTVSFIVEKDGSVSNLKLESVECEDKTSPSSDCPHWIKDEALRMIKNKCTPAYILVEGKGRIPVRYKETYSTRFLCDNTIYNQSQVSEFIGAFPRRAFYEYVKENMVYPKECAEGRVIVSFVYEKNGTTSNIRILKGSGCRSMDVEAVRLVRNFKSTNVNYLGCPVRVETFVPIAFKVNQ